MKGTRMNVETLSKAELLMLLSILEGELEAQDVVIHTLREQQRDTFVQQRYGQYDLSDPFIALLRDSELVQAQDDGRHSPVCLNPLGVLKLVMAHCSSMREKLMKQLAAAERRHRRVISDLEEEKRRRAQDAAAGDDITAMLERERDRLLQQLEFEKAKIEQLESERSVLSNQAVEDLVQQQQLSSTLAKECQKATARAEEESQRVAELSRQLEQESSTIENLKGELQSEHARAQQIEARTEKKLAEFDTECEQMRGKLLKEEKRYCELLERFNSLKKELDERKKADLVKDKENGHVPQKVSAAISQAEVDGKILPSLSSPQQKQNGHHTPRDPESPVEDRFKEGMLADSGVVLSGGSGTLQCLSPSSPASSSLSSSPCSSPVLTKRLATLGCSSPTYPSSYQASINQRFQAARHKFQQQAEADQQHGGPVVHSPRDLSPTTGSPTPLDNTTAKQIARNTVTQVLSRFTSPTSNKLPASNSSPFGTDYRNLAGTSSPTKSPGILSPGIRSPIIPRAEKFHPPPVPPKKQGPNQSPNSAGSSGRVNHFPELSGSCGLVSSQEDAKELDLVMSSSS